MPSQSREQTIHIHHAHTNLRPKYCRAVDLSEYCLTGYNMEDTASKVHKKVDRLGFFMHKTTIQITV